MIDAPKRGRPPKPKTAEEAVSSVDTFLDRNLPDYVKVLDRLAKQGDRQAAVYLLDRRLGKPVERREDVSERLIQKLETLAKRLGRKRQHQELPAGDRRALPDRSEPPGVVDGVWQEAESPAGGDLHREES